MERWTILGLIGVAFLCSGCELLLPTTGNFPDHRARRIAKMAKTPEATWGHALGKLVREGKICIGMTKAQVRMSWGLPYHINKSVYPSGVQEQWVYGNGYVYFQKGILTSYQLSR